MIEKFKQLPREMQAVMGGLAGAVVLAFAAIIDGRAVVVLLVGVLFVAIVIGAWFWNQRRKARQRARVLAGQIAVNTGAAPSAVGDPAGRAKLDDLRKNFQAGVDKFRAAGKDLYSLPWYVVCGEPGSGKSEAIRHCGVGFPPGLQDEMQGAGGTLNMHWWFTNHAVLLDTAGKLLFQDAPPGSTTEWSEFLALLKKSRPNCPINGLLLVIPSESLIRDSLEEIQKKAGKIVRQLDQIQRVLDVRFPVFVLVTKCDLINGFREFFSGIKDPQLQHQMTGWSNPDPLDTPFQPEAVDRHLELVVERISRRRLGLLKDPVATEASARRIDEVDALFALPASISALAPHLRKYLETIFAKGAWAAKPLFLRGIYFTSAITEGAALDQEIAVALGLPVESLPEGKAWVRERSFFLRDLFLQKIFKERGLVTRASNTRQQRRRRRTILASAVGGGLVLLLAFSWFSASSLERSIGAERDLWMAGASGWIDRYWRPIIKPEHQGAITFAYTGAERVEVGGGTMTVVELHQELQRVAARDIHVPWVFKPMEALVMGANAKRREAQHILYETGVVLPLLDAARLRMGQSAEWVAADDRALALLVQLEGLIHLRGVDGYTNEMAAEEFIGPLLTRWLKPPVVPEALLRVFDWTYYGGGAGKEQWPGPWLSDGRTLRDNHSIDQGWTNFAKAVEQQQAERLSGLEFVRSGRLSAGAFLNAEREFQRAIMAPRGGPGWADEITRRFATLSDRQQALEALVAKAVSSTRFGPDGFTLAGGYTTITETSRQQGLASTRALATVLGQQKRVEDAAADMKGTAAEFTLARDIRRRLQDLTRQLASASDQAFAATEQAELPTLDAVVFRPSVEPAQRLFSYRYAVYRDAVSLLNPISGENPRMIGRLAELVGHVRTQEEALRKQIDKYTSGGREDFQPTARQLVVAAGELGFERLATLYVAAIDRELEERAGYPLTRMGNELTNEQVKSFFETAAKVRADLGTPGLTEPARKILEKGTDRFMQMGEFAAALIPAADGTPRKFRLTFPDEAEQRKALSRSGVALSNSELAGKVYRNVRIGTESYRNWAKPGAAVWFTGNLADRIPVIEFFRGNDLRRQAEVPWNFGGAWAALRALEEGAVRRSGGREWDRIVTLPESDGESRLLLTFVFDAPLPPVDQWPR